MSEKQIYNGQTGRRLADAAKKRFIYGKNVKNFLNFQPFDQGQV